MGGGGERSGGERFQEVAWRELSAASSVPITITP
jgi:hypothetical protein